MLKLRLTVILFAAAAGLAGCQAPAPTTRTYSHVHLPEVSRDAAFAAAYTVMRERYPIASSNSESGEMTSAALESTEQAEGGRASDYVGASRRMRRVVTTRVTGTGASADAWCKIVVQRLDTASAQMFSSDLSINDTPTGTAADREGATTREQNEIWHTTHRDKTEERTVLEAIREAVRGENPDARTGGGEPSS